jgi:hypothetical protein
MRGVGPGATLAERLIGATARASFRSQSALHAAYPRLNREQIARILIDRAINTSGRVGLGGGVIGSSQYFAPWTLRGVPAQIMAEAFAIAAVEVRLTAELHALYGIEASGTIKDRAGFWVTAWAKGTAHDPRGPHDFTAAMRKVVAVQTRRRLARRARRNLLTLAPMLSGAALGRWVNRRQTREFANSMHESIKRAVGQSLA